MKSAKKNVILFICILGILLVLVSIPTIIVDPFFQYHKPLKGFPYRIDNQINQNPGMAKSFDYDSVILGSSVTDNFNTDKFREYMGLTTAKLSANGARPKDIDELLKIVKSTHPQISKVFLGIDIFFYHDGIDDTSCDLPEYLYDNNLLNDAPYLINKEVFTDYILYPFFKREGTPFNEIYCNYKEMSCGKEYVRADFVAPEMLEKKDYDAFSVAVEENMDAHIIPYIQSMPDTEFVVFFSPYSIVMWFLEDADGNLEADLHSTKLMIEKLLEYDNVTVYFFQNDYQYITDLDNYCDNRHFSYLKNDEMTYEFSKDDSAWKLNKENYRDVLSGFEDYLKTYDYEEFINWK